MVVVMTPEASDADVAHVVEKVESVGGEAFVSKGVVRTIIGLVGDIDSFHGLNLRSLPGVANVHRISDPYKLVSRQHHPDRSTVWVRGVPVGHIFDVITRGFGAMSDFSDRITPEDRWAIAAYIRTLQYSQQAKLEELPADMRQELERSAQ